jgi:hypothetical protein
VAWASLKYPHSLRPLAATVENPLLLEQVTSESNFPMGFNGEVWNEITKGFAFPEPGFDPNKHFRTFSLLSTPLPTYQIVIRLPQGFHPAPQMVPTDTLRRSSWNYGPSKIPAEGIG